MSTSFSSMGFRGTPRPVINFRPTIITGDSIEVANANEELNTNSLVKMTNAGGRQLKRSRITDDDEVINIQTDLLSVSGELQCPTVTTLQSGISGLQSDTKTLQDDTKVLQTDVLGLEDITAALEDDITDLQADTKTLQTRTQYMSVINPTITTFTGFINATSTIGVGVAQSGQTGYNLPLSRPLIAGYTLVTPTSTGNTLSFRLAADPDKIANITSAIAGVSTSFTGTISSTGNISSTADMKCINLIAHQVTTGISPNQYSLPIIKGTIGQVLTATATGTEFQDVGSVDVSALENKTQNLTADATSSTFSNELKTQGPLTVVNTVLNRSYSLPVQGPEFVNSKLISTNSTGTLRWDTPSNIWAYRTDLLVQPTNITFTALSTEFELLSLIFGGWVGTGELKHNIATGVQYTGNINRLFSASFHATIRGEVKGATNTVRLRMYAGPVNTTNAIASTLFEIKETVTQQWNLNSRAIISPGDYVTVTLTTLSGDHIVSIGSPNFSMSLY